MMFQKPKDVSYTDMCIYIDNHVYSGDFDESLVYQYIYLIANMLAHRRKFFKKSFQYDDFSLMTASRVYVRLTNKKQFEVDEKGKPKLAKIKSVLNYIKTILYPMKVTYEQEHYSQICSSAKEIEFSSTTDIDDFMSVEILDFIESLPRVIKKFISKIPYKKNSPEWYNIYMSCLLTLSKDVSTLCENIKLLRNKENISNKQIYNLCKFNQVTLYHLNIQYTDYVDILSRELKKYIYREINDILNSHYIEEDCLRESISESIDTIIREED